MAEQCSPTAYEQIGAIYVPGSLIIWASGSVSHPSYKVRIEPSSLMIYPPMYNLMACSEEFITGLFLPTPYKTFASFERGKPKEEYIPVNTAEGRVEVPLFVLDPIPFDPNDKVTANLAGGGEGMPWPFGGVPTLFRLPVNLSRVFESGKSEDVEIPKETIGLKRVEATGYSYSFSFDEAFRNALRNLPPDDSGIADKLTTVHVDSIGAEFGGIAGISRMKVKVSTFY
jgi:hypothetical protein